MIGVDVGSLNADQTLNIVGCRSQTLSEKIGDYLNQLGVESGESRKVLLHMKMPIVSMLPTNSAANVDIHTAISSLKFYLSSAVVADLDELLICELNASQTWGLE